MKPGSKDLAIVAETGKTSIATIVLVLGVFMRCVDVLLAIRIEYNREFDGRKFLAARFSALDGLFKLVCPRCFTLAIQETHWITAQQALLAINRESDLNVLPAQQPSPLARTCPGVLYPLGRSYSEAPQ